MNNVIIKNDVKIENMIYEIRGKQVMLDSDLAKLYNVETKRINEAVKNNIEKFPERYCFKLSDNESDNLLVETFDQKIEKRGGKYKNPRVFTEQGVYMLATILKSKEATKITIAIMDAIPMIIPSIVRIDRPLLLLIFIRAIFIYSHACATIQSSLYRQLRIVPGYSFSDPSVPLAACDSAVSVSPPASSEEPSPAAVCDTASDAVSVTASVSPAAAPVSIMVWPAIPPPIGTAITFIPSIMVPVTSYTI